MKNPDWKFTFLVVLLSLFLITNCFSQDETSVASSKQDSEDRVAKSAEDGFVELYNGKDLTGWITAGNWIPQDDGSLLIQPRENEIGWGRFGSYLWTNRKYKDFELKVECAYPPNGNSGIYFRVDDRNNPVYSGIEAQVFDSSKHKGPLNDHTLGGIIPAGIVPSKNLAKPPGQWNQMVIRCVGDRLQVKVNGEEVVNTNLQDSSLKDRQPEGYIGLQDHGVPHSIRFRNIQIKEIESAREGEDASVLFKREVLPIFEDRCIYCHGADEQEGDLSLDTMTNIVRSGNSGEPAVIIGDDTNSHIVQLLLTDDKDHRMPLQDDPLEDAEIEMVRKWIRVTDGWDEAITEARIRKSDHWSFQPIQKPDVPQARHENPIDSFIKTRLIGNRLTFSTEASHRRLIRRLYLVVHGIPPSPEQVWDFATNDNDSPNKWEQLVDGALASPHYGERAAVSWLDLVRFSETDGFEVNAERLGAWRYRDWVISAFNNDMPYDRFVSKQLAGDNIEDSIGKAYLVAGSHNVVVELDKKGQADNVQNEVSDFLNTTGTTFLGLTLGCARCHNHKFDPISQQDFYSVQAIFSGVNHGLGAVPSSPERLAELAKVKAEIEADEAILEPYKSASIKKDPVNAVKNVESFEPVDARFVRLTINGTTGAQGCVDELEIFSSDDNLALASKGATATSGGDFVHARHRLSQINDGQYGNSFSWISKEVKGWVQIKLARNAKIDRVVWGRDRTGIIADRQINDYQIETSVDQKTWITVGDSRQRRSGSDPVVSYAFDNLPNAEKKIANEKHQRLTTLLAKKSELEKPSTAYIGTFSPPKTTYRLSRGDAMSPKEPVLPNTIAVIGDLGLPATATGPQRRTAFANWVGGRENPLTARVMVNRIWQFHFGQGLVSTPNDFGMNGSPPSHPELLDWLAAEFIESGWSVKHIHKLILTSKTWKQDSRPNAAAMVQDSATQLLWRFPPRRLEAEAIRDSILAATSKLDRSMGGPGFSGFEVGNEYVRHYFPKKEYGPEDWRRMVYMTRVRKEVESVFGVFDCPEGNQGTPIRTRSTTPLQALNLFNSEFVTQQAEFLAKRLESEGKDRGAIVVESYQLCFGRRPSDREAGLAIEMIEQIGLIQYCRVLLNSNEFVFIL